MKIKPGTYCPLIKKDCIEFKCRFWIQLRGTHPQTGQPVDEWDCAVAWMPVLAIEGVQQTKQAAAAIEHFRNEMVRFNTDSLISSKIASFPPLPPLPPPQES